MGGGVLAWLTDVPPTVLIENMYRRTNPSFGQRFQHPPQSSGGGGQNGMDQSSVLRSSIITTSTINRMNQSLLVEKQNEFESNSDSSISHSPRALMRTSQSSPTVSYSPMKISTPRRQLSNPVTLSTPPASTLDFSGSGRMSSIQARLKEMTFEERDLLVQTIYNKSQNLGKEWMRNVWDEYVQEMDKGLS